MKVTKQNDTVRQFYIWAGSQENRTKWQLGQFREIGVWKFRVQL